MSTDITDFADLKNLATDSKYPVWSTVDGKAPAKTNEFFPQDTSVVWQNGKAWAPHVKRIEFVFPTPVEIDHITYASPGYVNSYHQITALQWAELTNAEDVIYNTTQIGYSDDWGSTEGRWLAFNGNGQLVRSKEQLIDKNDKIPSFNFADGKTKPVTSIEKETLKWTFGLNSLNWKVKNNELSSTKKISDLGNIKEGKITAFASGPTNDFERMIEGFYGIQIYDENGNKIPFRIKSLETLSQPLNGGGLLTGYTINETSTSVYTPSLINNRDVIQNKLQDDNNSDIVFKALISNLMGQDEAFGLGRYEGRVSFRWEFADGLPHKIGYIKTKSQAPDRTFGQSLDTLGNYATRLGLSFLNENGNAYYVDSVQGTDQDPNTTLQNFKFTASGWVGGFESFFGIEPIQFQEIKYSIGDHFHLNWSNNFYQLHSSNWATQDIQTFVMDGDKQIPTSDYVINKFDKKTFRVRTWSQNYIFKDNNSKNFQDIVVDLSASSAIKKPLVLADDIKTFANFTINGTNGNAYIDIQKLKSSENIDVIMERRNAQGVWSDTMKNYSPSDLINGDTLLIRLTPKDNYQFVDFSGTPLSTTIEKTITISGLKDSVVIQAPASATFNLSGKTSLAKYDIPALISSSREFSYEFQIKRNGQWIDYGTGVNPEDIRNGDEVHINLVAKPGMTFETNGITNRVLSDYFVTQVSGLSDPSFIAKPAVDKIVQSNFHFSNLVDGKISIVSNSANHDDVLTILNTLESNPDINVSYEINESSSLIPIKSFTNLTAGEKFQNGNELIINIAPKQDKVFGTAQNYLNTIQTIKIKIKTEVSSSNIATIDVAHYAGDSVFPQNLTFNGTNGNASIELNSAAWTYTDISNLFSSENTQNQQFEAYLVRADDVANNQIAAINDSDPLAFEAIQSGDYSQKIVLNNSANRIFDNIKNGDTIYFVARKDTTASWYSNDMNSVKLPAGNTYFKKYTVGGLLSPSIAGSDLALPNINLNLVGHDGAVRILQNNNSTNRNSATSLIENAGLATLSNAKIDAFVISSFIDPTSEQAQELPTATAPYQPYFYADGYNASEIPAIDAMDSVAYDAAVENGTAPWIRRMDAKKVYSNLPIYSGDRIAIWIHSADDKTPIANNFYSFFKVFTVPELSKHATPPTLPSDLGSFIVGVDGSASLVSSLTSFDPKEVNFKLEITNSANKKQSFNHVPSKSEYGTIKNGDTIVITANVKNGYWWGDQDSPSDLFAMSKEIKQTYTVQGLTNTSQGIKFQAISITEGDFDIIGTNGNAQIKVKPGSNLYTLMSATASDYSFIFKLVHDSKTKQEYPKGTFDPNQEFFKTAKNGDKILLTYSAKSPKQWIDAPNAVTSKDTNQITINSLSQNIFNDGKVSKDLGLTLSGTSGHVKVSWNSIDSALGSLKVSVEDSSGNVKVDANGQAMDDITPNTFIDGIENTDKIVAKLTPNHPKYWADYNAQTIANPATDVYVFTKVVDLPEYVDAKGIMNYLKEHLFSDRVNFDLVFKDRKGIYYSGATGNQLATTMTVDPVALQQIIDQSGISTADFDINISLFFADSNVPDIQNYSKSVFTSGQTTNSKINSNSTSASNWDSYFSYKIVATLKSTATTKTLDKDGTFEYILTSNVKQMGDNDTQSRDFWKLWSLFDVGWILSKSNLDLKIASYETNIDNDPLVLVSNDKSSSNVDNIFNILNAVINAGGEIKFVPSDSKNKTFVYSKTTKDFEIAKNGLKISLTFQPNADIQKVLVPGESYHLEITNGSTQSSRVKFFDDSTSDVTSIDLSQGLVYDPIFEGKEIVINNKYYTAIPGSINDILIDKTKNPISGSGELDLAKMGIPDAANLNQNYSYDLTVERNGQIINSYQDIDSSTIVGSLAVGDKVTLNANIRTDVDNNYRFAKGASTIVVVSRQLDIKDLQVIIDVPQVPDVNKIGLVGLSGFGSVARMNELAIKNTQYELYVQKSGSQQKQKVTAFKNLENGDKIFIKYTIPLGGKFRDPHYPDLRDDYEINYDITTLTSSLKVPNLKVEYIKFKSRNLKLHPNIKWDSIFNNNYDVTKIKVSFKVFDSAHNQINLVDPSNPNNKTWLQNMYANDIANPNAAIKSELSKLALSLDQYLVVDITTDNGYEFENYQGKKISVEAKVTSASIEKDVINIPYDFNFQAPTITPNISGYAGLSDTEFPLAAIKQLPVDAKIAVTNSAGAVLGTYINSLPDRLANGQKFTLEIIPNDKIGAILKMGNRMLEKFTRTWLVTGLREVISNPQLSNVTAMRFSKFNGQGRIIPVDFGDNSKYLIKYQVKYAGKGTFENPVSTVTSLSNGDTVKAIISPASGYAFIDTNTGQEIPSFETSEVVVSGLIIPRYDVDLPKSLVINWISGEKRYVPANFEYTRYESDKQLHVKYTVNGTEYQNWLSIPNTAIKTGGSIKIDVDPVLPEIFFKGDVGHLSHQFTIMPDIVTIPDIKDLKANPFDRKADGTFSLNVQYLPVIPNMNYYYSLIGLDGSTRVVTSTDNIALGETLLLKIAPSNEGYAYVLDESLGNGELTLMPQIVKTPVPYGINLVWPDVITWAGKDGHGGIDLTDTIMDDLFKTFNVKFAFEIKHKDGKTETVFSLTDLNLSNGDTVKITSETLNNEVFADGTTKMTSKEYLVAGLVVDSKESIKSMVLYSTAGAVSATVAGGFALNLSRLKKLFRRK